MRGELIAFILRTARDFATRQTANNEAASVQLMSGVYGSGSCGVHDLNKVSPPDDPLTIRHKLALILLRFLPVLLLLLLSSSVIIISIPRADFLYFTMSAEAMLVPNFQAGCRNRWHRKVVQVVALTCCDRKRPMWLG